MKTVICSDFQVPQCSMRRLSIDYIYYAPFVIYYRIFGVFRNHLLLIINFGVFLFFELMSENLTIHVGVVQIIV